MDEARTEGAPDRAEASVEDAIGKVTGIDRPRAAGRAAGPAKDAPGDVASNAAPTPDTTGGPRGTRAAAHSKENR